MRSVQMSSKPIVKLQFLGGVATGDLGLTGSCILLTVMFGKKTIKILIDLGLIQCKPECFFTRNLEILNYLDPRTIDVVILTHSHTDHVSRLPLLTKHGFSGRIFCTYATADILEIMLSDSAKIQKELLKISQNKTKKVKNKREKGFLRDKGTLRYDKLKGRFKNHEHVDVLYKDVDVSETIKLVKYGGCDYHTNTRIAKDVDLVLYHSGHVLGGAICVIKIKDPEAKDICLGFSGDLGREDGIILPPPEFINEQLNCWVTESTYGGKIHPHREEEIEKLKRIIKEAGQNKGVIIIPSFALERTQEIVYLLSYYMEIGEIPKINIYLDSPMAAKITNVFAAYWDKGMFADQGKLDFNPFDINQNCQLKIIPDSESSRGFAGSVGPYIIIAGSGNCDAGRVRSHLRLNLAKKNTYICLVGYMPPNSLGNRLKENPTSVRMNDQEIIIKANIASFDSLSAHADGKRLVEFTKKIIENFKTEEGEEQKIYIVHGDPPSAVWLKHDIMKAMNFPKGLADNICIPTLNQICDISE